MTFLLDFLLSHSLVLNTVLLILVAAAELVFTSLLLVDLVVCRSVLVLLMAVLRFKESTVTLPSN